LWEEYRIVIPVMSWAGQPLVRMSIQGYNTQDDVDTFVEAVERLLPEVPPKEDA
jgi:selenocysteine lyase/cysteine desulfurase